MDGWRTVFCSCKYPSEHVLMIYDEFHVHITPAATFYEHVLRAHLHCYPGLLRIFRPHKICTYALS